MSLSFRKTRPEVGRKVPVMTLNSVVLPAPLGPIKPVMEPAERLGRLADQHGDRVGLESLAWLDRLWSQRVTGILEGG